MAVGQRRYEDGVDDGEDDGEGAAAQHGGHQGGLGHLVGVEGEREQRDKVEEKSRRWLVGCHQQAQDVDDGEKAGPDQDPDVS